MKNKKIIHISVIFALALTAFAIAFAMISKINSLEHENVAKKFSTGEKYSQITLFIPESAEFTLDKVMYFRYKLDKKLTEESMESDKARLYVDAYSAFKDMRLDSDSFRSANVKAAFVGGDYKLFHKEFEYAPDFTNDINHDRILLSRTAAWQLYGGTNLYDFRAVSQDKTYYISGVYDDYKDTDYVKFYENKPSCLADIQQNPNTNITCYELLVVNPVKDFAKNMVVECIDLDKEIYLLVENSSRFSFMNLLKKIPTLIQADIPLPTGVNITPEEIAARRAEKELAVMLAILLVFALYPTLWIIILLFRLIRLVKRLFNKYVVSKIKDKLSYA